MTLVNRRTQHHQPSNNKAPIDTKHFNDTEHIVIDTYRYVLSQGTSPQTPTLSNIGYLLKGISIIPVASGDISDTALTFGINSFNLTNGANCQNFNPGFVHAMTYFKLPQPLKGNDAIKASFNKTDAGSVTVYLNIFYVPR